jgi:hypothetical protein
MYMDSEAFNFSDALPFTVCYEFNSVHVDIILSHKKKKEGGQIKNVKFIYSAIKENVMLVSSLVLSLVIHTFQRIHLGKITNKNQKNSLPYVCFSTNIILVSRCMIKEMARFIL